MLSFAERAFRKWTFVALDVYFSKTTSFNLGFVTKICQTLSQPPSTIGETAIS
ncbi:hypothetical protein HPTD01_1321 [Halomonas sp. TD01]|nr:hypothetical protein HPTD01_1321 [Halomonas sp. TD01]